MKKKTRKVSKVTKIELQKIANLLIEAGDAWEPFEKLSRDLKVLGCSNKLWWSANELNLGRLADSPDLPYYSREKARASWVSFAWHLGEIGRVLPDCWDATEQVSCKDHPSPHDAFNLTAKALAAAYSLLAKGWED